MGTMMIFASDGSFELRMDPYTEGMRFEATHKGLVDMAAVLEALGGTVYMTPSLEQPNMTGLPPGYDAKGFVETAFTLSKLGLNSQPGGEA